MESNQLSEDEKKFYEELFSLYDTENRGYIDIDRFIKVTKEKMPPDQWKNDQQLQEFVKILDPFNFGQIDFGQFVIGIKKLTNDEINSSSETNRDQTSKKDAVVTNLIDSSLSLIDGDFEGKSNSISSNETFLEYDSELKSPINSPNSSCNAGTGSSSAGVATNETNKTADSSLSTTNFDQQIFELGGNASSSSGGESENDADKHSSSTFDMATFDRKELNDFELQTGGELIILDEFGNSKATSRQTSTTSGATAITNAATNSSNEQKITGSKGDLHPQQQQEQQRSELEDPFGLDIEVINNHRKSLSINSFSSLSDFKTQQPTMNKRNSIMNSKRRVSELYQNQPQNPNKQQDIDFSIIDNGEYSNDQSLYKSMHLDTHEHDQLIEEYENKIKLLSMQNENLLIENKEYLNRMTKLNNDNLNLIEKIRELEESNIEIEKKLQVLLNEEKLHYQDQLNKVNAKLNEEKDNYLIQISMLENQISLCKEESFKYLKDVTELSKKIEANEDRLNDETEKYVKLKSEFQKVIRERESVQKAHEIEHMQELQRNEVLTKELEDLRYKYNLMQKQRSNTVNLSSVGDSSGSAATRELEAEIRQLRSENEQLNNQLEEERAHAIKSGLDNGRMLLHLSASNAQSLAAEMDVMSKDELMDKLKTEQGMSQRLREYIDNMICKIMEYSPEILEICTSSGSTTKQSSSKQMRGVSSGSNDSIKASFRSTNSSKKF